MQLINDDYEEFISLGNRPARENSPPGQHAGSVIRPHRTGPVSRALPRRPAYIARLPGQVPRWPPSVIAAKLAARAELREERVRETIALEQHTQLRSLQAMLSMINRMIETVSRAELLWTTRNTGDRAKIVARVASEYNQILYLARKAEAEHCKIVKTLETVCSNLVYCLGASLTV